MSPAGRCVCETHCTAEGFAGTSIIMELMRGKKTKKKKREDRGDIRRRVGVVVVGVTNNNNGVLRTGGELNRPLLSCNCLS